MDTHKYFRIRKITNSSWGDLFMFQACPRMGGPLREHDNTMYKEEGHSYWNQYGFERLKPQLRKSTNYSYTISAFRTK